MPGLQQRDARPGGTMDLDDSRRRAAELSGGTSDESVKELIVARLREEGAAGDLLDFGAGRGALLARLHALRRFDALAGIDLFERPADLPASIDWHRQDLNDAVDLGRQFSTIVCSETIEHLENPRHVFRTLRALVRPGGLLVLTMPNQESLRSYAGLMFAGHFTHFLGSCYPAHITALLRMDLQRLCAEAGFRPPSFRYSDLGGIPRFPTTSWQSVSFGLLRGRLFSDTVCMTTRAADRT